MKPRFPGGCAMIVVDPEDTSFGTVKTYTLELDAAGVIRDARISDALGASHATPPNRLPEGVRAAVTAEWERTRA